MARIRVLNQGSSVLVIIGGHLGAADMRRLEHACAPALTAVPADLVVDVQAVTGIDAVAQAHLDHIATRGAIIRKL